jgi:hypothetical protein
MSQSKCFHIFLVYIQGLLLVHSVLHGDEVGGDEGAEGDAIGVEKSSTPLKRGEIFTCSKCAVETPFFQALLPNKDYVVRVPICCDEFLPLCFTRYLHCISSVHLLP